MRTSHATSNAAFRTKLTAAHADGELLANRKVLISTRKQIDDAYRRICGPSKRKFNKPF